MEDRNPEIQRENKKNVLQFLTVIDKKLELIVKILGYISVLLVTPMIFSLSYLGVDVNSILGIKDLTPAQKEIVRDLQAKGFSADRQGSAKALSDNNPIFTQFMKAEIYPDQNLAEDAINSIFNRNISPNFDVEYFRGYVINNPHLLNIIKEKLKKIDEFTSIALKHSIYKINEWSALNERIVYSIKSADEYCSLYPSLKNDGMYFYSYNGSAESCMDSFKSGTVTVYLKDTINSRIYWGKIFNDSEKLAFDDDSILPLAFLASSYGVKPTSLNSKNIFASLKDGEIVRIVADAKLSNHRQAGQNYASNDMIFKVATGKAKLNEMISQRLWEHYTDVKATFCQPSCKFDITAIKIGQRIFAIDGHILGSADDQLINFAYFN